MKAAPVLLACAAAFAACSPFGPDGRRGGDISEEVRRSERGVLETANLASLSALEHALNDYVRAEGRIPKSLDDLIPKYLAEVPEVTGLPTHKDSAKVTHYSGSVISDGLVNGSLIRDLGGWGYAYNDSQVIVFVNCTHKNLSGLLWYQARGGT